VGGGRAAFFTNLRDQIFFHDTIILLRSENRRLDTVHEAIRQLMAPTEKKKRKIGFKRDKG